MGTLGPTARKCLVIKLVLILNLSLKLVNKDLIASHLRMIMKYLLVGLRSYSEIYQKFRICIILYHRVQDQK